MATKSLSPLQSLDKAELARLYRALWSWPVGNGSALDGAAGTSSPRSTRLLQYLNYYKDLTASYECEIAAGEQMALSCHSDLFRVMEELKSKPDVPRSKLLQSAFSHAKGASFNWIDQNHALNIAVQARYMINCTALSRSVEMLENGLENAVWKDRASFVEFFSETFQKIDHPSINDKDESVAPIATNGLTARKLKKTAHVVFRATDDLRNHLKLDRKTGVLQIFHHTAFLKEHLRLTKDEQKSLSLTGSFKKGALPRQLALEVLDSIQKLLFPLTDPKSNALLRSLTATASFDPDCLRFESSSIRNADEKEIQYLYFGSRLLTLVEELEDPSPRGWLQEWFERKKSARWVVIVAILSVVFAVLLGMASLAVGGYQAWVGYQAWKHPVQG